MGVQEIRDELDLILTRGVAEIIVEGEFRKLLASGRKLRLKQGFDPSSPHMHLGNAVGPRKLRQLQELGHQVVLIVGDWTAQIGDPSGRDDTRPRLSPEQVKANAQHYQEQFGKIVDLSRTEVRWQSEWYGNFQLEKVFDLASRFTLAQMLAHETFRKRYDEGLPLTLLELLYPLLQAYDSVAIQADVEFGGTDQKFNNLVGRDLQASLGMPPQQVFLVPLIPGTDGQKMGKSAGNTIDILSPPEDMYGKIMSMADEVMPIYFETLTDVPEEELAEFQRGMEAGTLNPMQVKQRLAREIVAQFHDAQAAQQAEAHFRRVFQERQAPEEMLEVRATLIPVSGSAPAKIQFSWRDEKGNHRSEVNFGKIGTIGIFEEIGTQPLVPSRAEISVTEALAALGLANSRSKARRLLDQGSLELNGKKLSEDLIELKATNVLKVGRRSFVTIFVQADKKEAQ